MYDAGSRHYYIDELAQLKSGTFVIPVRWLEDHTGCIFADAYTIAFNDQVSNFLFVKLQQIIHQVYSTLLLLLMMPQF